MMRGLNEPSGLTETVSELPLPQSIVTMCVSAAPGSVTIPLTYADPHSLISVIGSNVTIGERLDTVTRTVATSLPVSSSSTVTVIV